MRQQQLSKYLVRDHAPRGFTLIELLVVVSIISILYAVSVPQYNNYRKRAFDLRAQTDLRNVATAEEAYFVDAEKYLSCDNAECAALPGIKTLSKGVELSVTAEEARFTATSTHPGGSGRIFSWDSDAGGMIE